MIRLIAAGPGGHLQFCDVAGMAGRPIGPAAPKRWNRIPCAGFDLFARHAATVAQGAQALQRVLRGGEETLAFCQRVNQFESEADSITREVLTAVRRTFITPFDRGPWLRLSPGRRSIPYAVDRAFRILQFGSASFYWLGHGGNDAQKTMGIIAVLLYSQGYLGSEFGVPFWVSP